MILECLPERSQITGQNSGHPLTPKKWKIDIGRRVAAAERKSNPARRKAIVRSLKVPSGQIGSA